MIKNKINQVKFPNAYERDGNDLLRPHMNFHTQNLELHTLAQQVTTGEDYHMTLNHLKKHHQSRVMPENNSTSVVDLIKERVVTSASARDQVESQGTTGLLNIIDQNQNSIH